MEPDLTPKHLRGATEEILDIAAFVLTESIDSPPDWDGSLIEAELRFTGPSDGRMRMIAPVEFGAELAAGMLGIDIDDPECASKEADSMAELLNMVAGVYMESLFDKETRCRLEAPTTRVLTAAEIAPPPTEDAATVTLLAEDEYRIDMIVQLDS